jgi:Fe-S-cluster containining protein
MDWNDELHSVQAAQKRLDEQIKSCLSHAPEQQVNIHCHAGCGNCCTLAVNCSFSEALLIARNLPEKLIQALHEKVTLLQQISRKASGLKSFLQLFRSELGGCPFLDAEACCAIYGVRPFSCRALLSTRPADWCGVDFSTLHPLEKQAFMSSLNREVVNFPTHYLAKTQELAVEHEAETVARLFDGSGVALSGNLIYLVWLEREYGLSTIISKGAEVFSALLHDKQLDLPYLLQARTGH